jgi:hypothetical protein
MTQNSALSMTLNYLLHERTRISGWVIMYVYYATHLLQNRAGSRIRPEHWDFNLLTIWEAHKVCLQSLTQFKLCLLCLGLF